MKIWKKVRFVLYVLVAILIAIFANVLIDHLKYLIGFLIAGCGLEKILVHLLTRKSFEKHNHFFLGSIEMLLGVVVLLAFDEVNDFKKICVIWCLWAILREAYDIEDAVHNLINRDTGILEILESLFVITFFVILLINPSKEKVLTHLYILSIELVCTVAFPYISYVYRKNNPRKVKKEAFVEEDNEGL